MNNIHSHNSLLVGLAKPHQIAEEAVRLGYAACTLTDRGTVAGVPGFLKACGSTCTCGHRGGSHDENGKGRCLRKGCSCEKYEKATLKGIAGMEANTPDGRICLYAKNQDGWAALVKAASLASTPENYPFLKLSQVAQLAGGNLIAVAGPVGTTLGNVCFGNPNDAHLACTYDKARGLVNSNWEKLLGESIREHQEAFGSENLYLGVQLIDQETVPAQLVACRIMRHVGKKLGVKRVAVAPSYYARKEDSEDQRILLCIRVESTLQNLKMKLERGEEPELLKFLRSNAYYITSPAHVNALHASNPEELEGAAEITTRCESPKISKPPMIPVFDCPQSKEPEIFFSELCEAGFTSKLAGKVSLDELPKYRQELEYQLKVLNEAGLASYFLIVGDYIRYAREQLKAKIGKGRGSAAGCLPSYLIDITRVDPIKYGLLFSRFYNNSRCVPAHVNFGELGFEKFRNSK